MPNNPGRPAPGPWEGGAETGERGWGSPVPAGYGSLRGAGPAVAEPPKVAAPEGVESAGAGGPATRDMRRRHQATKPTLSERLRAAGAARAKARSTANGSASPAAAAANDAWHWTARSSEPVADAAPTTAPPSSNGAAAAPARQVPAERRPVRSRRPAEAWARGTVRHVDVLSVAKVSLIFYLLVLIIVVVASVLLWVVADAFGSIHSIERSVKTLFDLKKFTLHPTTVAAYTSAGGVVLAVAGTLANVLAALMYNLISDLVGGVRIDVSSPGMTPEGDEAGRVGSRVR